MTDTHIYPDWSRKAYLVIDDFSVVHRMLRGMLHKLGARTIDTVKNGTDAIAMLREKQYDVVLCDYNFSEGPNGQQILEEARHRDLVGLTCIWIMVSSEKAIETVMGVAEQAPDGYILKPLTESLLLARLNRAWDRKQAFTAIERAYSKRDYLLAATLCDQRLASAPLHAMDLLRMKASLLLKAGQLPVARRVYEHVLSLREQVWAKAGLAHIDSLEGHHADAKRRLQEIVREHPSFLDAYDQLAQAMQQLGETGQALEVLEQAVHLSPYSVVRQKSLGDVARQLGKFDIAEEAYRTSIAVGEYSILKSPDAYLALAKLYGETGRLQEAQEVISEARQIFPKEQLQRPARPAEGRAAAAGGLPPGAAQVDDRRASGSAAVKKTAQPIPIPASMPAPTPPPSPTPQPATKAAATSGLAPASTPAPAQALFQRAQVLLQYMKINGYNMVSSEEVRAVLARADKSSPGDPRTVEMLKTLQELAASGRK